MASYRNFILLFTCFFIFALIGCSLGSSDDDDITVTQTTLSGRVEFPESAGTKASIRAKVDFTKYRLYINGQKVTLNEDGTFNGTVAEADEYAIEVRFAGSRAAVLKATASKGEQSGEIGVNVKTTAHTLAYEAFKKQTGKSDKSFKDFEELVAEADEAITQIAESIEIALQSLSNIESEDFDLEEDEQVKEKTDKAAKKAEEKEDKQATTSSTTSTTSSSTTSTATSDTSTTSSSTSTTSSSTSTTTAASKKPTAVLAINEGAESTDSLSVTLNLTDIQATGVVTMSIDGADFIALNQAVTHTLTSGDGEKTVSIILKDDNGKSAPITDTIYLGTGISLLSYKKIGENLGGFSAGLVEDDYFGVAVTKLGDLNNDGVTELMVGAHGAGIPKLSGAAFVLYMNSDGTVASKTEIASGTGGFGQYLIAGDFFGSAIEPLGDFNGDGVFDAAVGAYGQDTSGMSGNGVIYLLYLTATGTVLASQTITHNVGGLGAVLAAGDGFGRSISSLGDLDGDSITDLAVTAWEDNTGDFDCGAAYILFLNANGTVKSSQKIAHNTGGLGAVLTNGDRFGAAVTSLGDLNGDGVVDIAVGAKYDDTGGTDRGAVYILFLQTDGQVKSYQKLADNTGGIGDLLASDFYFGMGLTGAVDHNKDGINDLLVSSAGIPYDPINPYPGVIHVLYLNKDGTVKSIPAPLKIANNTGGFGDEIALGDYLGRRSMTSIGDFNGDGTTDIAAGAYGDVGGSFYLLYLKK
ncbi:integrin alpha [Candidatus Riflebacteria bacterium]